jgi:hypothetical protein
MAFIIMLSHVSRFPTARLSLIVWFLVRNICKIKKGERLALIRV